MHIKTLQLKNFRRFEDATFEFGPGFNLLVGENGSGKSSVIEGVFASLNEYGIVADDVKNFNRLPKWSDIRRHRVFESGTVHFDQAVKCEISLNYAISENITMNDNRFCSLVGTLSPTSSNLAQFWQKTAVDFMELKKFSAPLVAKFSVPRAKNLSQIDGFSTYQTMLYEFRFGGYTNWRDAGRGSHDIDNWVVFQTLERHQKISRAEVKSGADELEIVSSAINRFIEDAVGIWFSGAHRCLMIDFKDGTHQPFDTLSDGQRGLIAMVADIARRACLLNPHLGENVLRDTPGIVLIDELDLHLHPKWQRSIVTNLKKTFPKIQFIATTHSPQIIGECKTDEIIIVTETGGKRPSQSFGMDSNWILECLMETPARDQVVQAKIDEMFKAIDENEFGNARALAAALREKIGPAPEVVKADILIHRYGGPRLAAGEAAE